MNFFKSITSTAALVVCSLHTVNPVQAGTFQDSVDLLELVKGTGTQVSFNGNDYDPFCKDRAGYYSFIKDEEDILVVCTSQVNEANPHEVWETVAHEAMHVAQACNGWEPVAPPKYHPRLLRELRTLAPHYAKILTTQYSGKDQLLEMEAFWAELQNPAKIMELFEIVCYNND